VAEKKMHKEGLHNCALQPRRRGTVHTAGMIYEKFIDVK